MSTNDVFFIGTIITLLMVQNCKCFYFETTYGWHYFNPN